MVTATSSSEFPQSREDAREHIRNIRRDKGLGDGPEQIGNNAADLESALNVLSHDLYQTATHFLLELIQNADDNTYDTDEPTLSISYSAGRVRIDCNERGFTRKNIEAICRICQSTKSGRSKSSGFVGEKGIGFKAVFKVASTVWISSGHYSFKFDRDAHLGMIAPLWQEFPERPKTGCTSILLKLDPNCNEVSIVDELRSYDPRILLFLRRLRKLEIKVDPGFLKLGSYSTVLRRGDYPTANPAMMTLQRDRNKMTYLVWRHTADDLPKEERRPGISSSEIVLAFPVTRDEAEPRLEKQNVYAFLPIRDYGFHFLLQADFLLPANREDVTADSQWNKALISAAAVAYRDAILHMSTRSSNLRYTLVRFIPLQPSQSPLFEGMREDILAKLRDAAFLESLSGRLRETGNFKVVPEKFCDDIGRPLLLSARNEETFLSTRYKNHDMHYIEALSVPIMTHYDFVVEMKDQLSQPMSFFANKSKAWHARFCRALTILDAKSRSTLRTIPLRTGQWVTPSEGPIYFPQSELKNATIPEGIDLGMKIVDPLAAKDRDRRSFFVLEGVRDFQDKDIAAAIRRTHADERFRPGDLSPKILVSHIWFLFQFDKGSHENTTYKLWVAGRDGTCRNALSTYLPLDIPGAASRVLPENHSASYGFLHPAYVEGEKLGMDEWISFLSDQVGVAVYPRLLRKRPSPEEEYPGGVRVCQFIHPDFLQLIQDTPSPEWLAILRDGWKEYRKVLEPSATDRFYDRTYALYRQERLQVVDHLKQLEVKCTGQMTATQTKLENTFRPLPEMVEESEGLVPFVEIPDPENRSWVHVLRSLGVGNSANLSFYIQCLRSAAAKDSIKMNVVRRLMKRLELTGAEDITLLRNTFSKEALIHIPPEEKSWKEPWVTTKPCIWRGESWLRRSITLERLYPGNEILFRNYLLVPNAGIDHIIKEAESIRVGHTTACIVRVFNAISDRLIRDGDCGMTSSQKEKLKMLAMFPVVTDTLSEPYEYLAAADDKRPWLIADRAIFRTQFQNILPVLGLTVETVLSIRRFLEAMDLGDRLLSGIATSVTEAHGDVEYSTAVTERYRARSEYFFRLVPDDQREEQHTLTAFRNVEVHLASTIVQYWRAPLGLSQVQSTQVDGVAFLESDYNGHLRIYLARGYENEAHPSELADQIRLFFNISDNQRDLLNVVIAEARTERINELFESRGIPPLVSGVERVKEGDTVVDGVFIPEYRPAGEDRPSKSESHMTRILRHTRFHRSVFGGSKESLPLAKGEPSKTDTVYGGVGQPPAVRESRNPVPLGIVKGTLRDLEYSQVQGAVVGQPPAPPRFLDKVKLLAHSDKEIGEMIVSDILEQALGANYERDEIWNKRRIKNAPKAAFSFTDTQGKFTALLARLDGGVPGRMQGHGNLIYHIDVKARDKSAFLNQANEFQLTQEELDRAREYSVQGANVSGEFPSPYKHIDVVAHITEVRTEPKIQFLVDPWDLFNDGQLLLQATKYKASLRLKPRLNMPAVFEEKTGFDAVQVKPVGGPIKKTVDGDWESEDDMPGKR